MPDYFVSVSNGRTGSTYLATCLNRLPDVGCDYEMKWQPAYQPSPGHIFLDRNSDLRETLAAISQGAEIVGSKLVLDPYLDAFINQDDAIELLNLFDRGVKIVHVTRNYIDIFMSFYARGPVSVRNDEAFANDSVLTQIARPQGTVKAQKTVTMSRSECLLSLLNMYHNDLLCLDLCRRADDYMTLPYTEIGNRLGAVSGFLGSRASGAEIQQIVDSPSMRKLEPIDRNNLPDFEYYEEICARLDGLLADEIGQLPGGSRKLSFPLMDGELGIRSDDPRLAGILSAIGER